MDFIAVNVEKVDGKKGETTQVFIAQNAIDRIYEQDGKTVIKCRDDIEVVSTDDIKTVMGQFGSK